MKEIRQATLRTLNILDRYQYPTIISTKGGLVTHPRYLDFLARMNLYVRISAAGIAESHRAKIDLNCSSFSSVLQRIRDLTNAAVPVSLRIQPVIPGFEESALKMTEQAAVAGTQHVSFEYLKLPTEKFSQTLAPNK